MCLAIGLFLYLIVAVVATAVIALVIHWIIRNHKLIIACVTVVTIGLAAIVILPTFARAEPKHVTVVIVYYEEDTFVVEDDNGYRDLYDDRGDLVPGDKLIIDGDGIKLHAQSNWVWFDVSVYGEPVASFLYAEDAEEVMDNIKEEQENG